MTDFTPDMVVINLCVKKDKECGSAYARSKETSEHTLEGCKLVNPRGLSKRLWLSDQSTTRTLALLS